MNIIFDHNFIQSTYAWSKSIIETLEQQVNLFRINSEDTRMTWNDVARTGSFIVNFEQVLDLVPVLLLLTLNR